MSKHLNAQLKIVLFRKIPKPRLRERANIFGKKPLQNAFRDFLKEALDTSSAKTIDMLRVPFVYSMKLPVVSFSSFDKKYNFIECFKKSYH